MCNKMYRDKINDPQDIPESGYAWKIFSIGRKQFIRLNSSYEVDKNGWRSCLL